MLNLNNMTEQDQKKMAKDLHDANNLIQRIYCMMLTNQDDDAGVIQEIHQQINCYIAKDRQQSKQKGA